MDNLTSAPRTSTGGGTTSPWQRFDADAYLDRRHRNWSLAEEQGDVRFDSSAGAVLVHGERAEHIVVTLRAEDGAAHLPLPPPSPFPVRQAPTAQPPTVRPRPTGRWRDLLGGLGLVAGGAVFVAALTVPLDDPALILSLMIAVRAGRLLLGVHW